MLGSSTGSAFTPPAGNAASANRIEREFKRHAAVEPFIGHLKDDHRMGCNYLADAVADAINAVLAASIEE
jgi:hypothetical protein